MDDGVKTVDTTGTELEDEGLLQRFKDWFKSSRNDSADWRKEAEESFDFVADHQWSEDDLKILRDQQRPSVTFNRCGVIVDAVCGMEVNNRQEIRYVPRQIGSAGVNEVITAAVAWFRDEGMAEDAESDAFRDSVICGMGWTDTRMNYEEGLEGKTLDERVDPLEIYWDTETKSRNILGGRFVMRLKENIDEEDAEAMFPDADCADLDASWASPLSDVGQHERHLPVDSYKFGNDADKEGSSKKIRMLQVQWWDREAYYRVQDPSTQEVSELSAKEYETAVARYASMGILLQGVKLFRKKYKQAFVGRRVLEVTDCPTSDRFTFQCITAKRDRRDNVYYGLLRSMKDPQRWANKWLSQVLHIINSNSKGGAFAETGAFENPRKAKAEWADADSLIMLREGGLNKIRDRPAITYPSGLDNLMQFAIASIRDVSGVNLEAVGLADREQAGVLEAHRKKAAMTVLATLFDSLRLFRKSKAKIYLEYVQRYLSNGQLVKINGPDGAKFVPLMRDKTATDYMVVVDDAPTSPNNKEQVWGVLTAMLPAFKDMMPPKMWAEILPYSPLPETLTQKLSGMILEAANNPAAAQKAQAADEANKRIIAMTERQIAAQVEKDKSTAALNIAKAQTEAVDAGVKRNSAFVDTFEAATKAINKI